MQGSRGRALKVAVPELSLEAGDRLEPSAALADIADFEAMELPATVVFWRPSRETTTRHRNPLFGPSTGITVKSLCVDTLHCLYLGVFQVHCAAVAWELIEADAWATHREGHTTAPERLQASCIRMQADLHRWCLARKKSHPGDSLTEVQEVTPKMLGTKTEPKLSLKGGETKTFLLFTHDFLQQSTVSVPHKAQMLAAGGALLRHIELLKNAPHVFSDADQQDLSPHNGNKQPARRVPKQTANCNGNDKSMDFVLFLAPRPFTRPR